MIRWQVIILIVTIMIGTITQATAVLLDPENDPHNPSTAVTGITEQKAITIAQQHFKGRVLAINQTDHAYRIKILSDQGTVHTIQINMLDGSVMITH